ncbi:hypothetical protein Q9L58_008309 [Maublancomyces gigas]|uniref:Uncharacterized protein n=1 Tax=Discina gigas TaxID=1032678 RepID=A0ABR3GA99_9PEZI
MPRCLFARWLYCRPCRALPARQGGSPARVANVDPSPRVTQDSPGESVSVSRGRSGRYRVSFLEPSNASNPEIQHALGTRSARDDGESRGHVNTENRRNKRMRSQGREYVLPGDGEYQGPGDFQYRERGRVENRERDGPGNRELGNTEHRRPEETQSGPHARTRADIPARPPRVPPVRPYNHEFTELLGELRSAAIGWRDIVGITPAPAVTAERTRPPQPLVRPGGRRPVAVNPGFSRLASRSTRHVAGHRQEPADPIVAPTDAQLLSRPEDRRVEQPELLVHAPPAPRRSRLGRPMSFAVSVDEPISSSSNASPAPSGSAIPTPAPAGSLSRLAQDASVLLEQFSQRQRATDYISDENRAMINNAATGIAIIQARLQETAVRGTRGIRCQTPINAGADCIICYSNSADTVFMPCKHLVVCGVRTFLYKNRE